MVVNIIILQERKLLVTGSVVRLAVQSYCQKIILLLSLAAGIRMTGGVVWAYNVQSFYDQYYCGQVNVGAYLSWIPLLGGIIGATAGGYVADRLAKRYGQVGRLVVLVTSQVSINKLCNALLVAMATGDSNTICSWSGIFTTSIWTDQLTTCLHAW